MRSKRAARRGTYDEARKLQRRYIVASVALWGAGIVWRVLDPAPDSWLLAGARVLVAAVASVLICWAAYQGGRAAVLKARAKDRSNLFAVGYHLGQLEGSTGGARRPERVDYDGDLVYQREAT